MSKRPQNHINCGAALEWIHLLLDKELPLAEHQKLLAHLQDCPNCSAAYGELGLLENAHAELDRALAAVPGGYFEDLPERVLARLAQTEARAQRSFSLPKPQLPKLQIPGWLQPVILGRGKYVLVFSAMLLLTFVITSQLRRDFSGEMIQTEDTLRVASPSVEESREAPLPTKGKVQDFAETKKPPAPSAAAPEPESRERATLPAASSFAEQPPLETNQKDTPLQAGQESDEQTPATVPERATEMDSKSIDLDRLAKEGMVSSHNAAGAGATASGKSHVAGGSTRVAMKMGSTQTADMSIMRFGQAGEQAQDAVSEPNRRKIWQQFLKTNPDSTHYAHAVVQIGQSFAAEIDSVSSPSQMQEALQFYDEQKSVLISKWGKVFFERERTRVSELLLWRKRP